MAYSQEKFDELFGKKEAFQKIAADNNVPLKQVLMKSPDIDEALAIALMVKWKYGTRTDYTINEKPKSALIERFEESKNNKTTSITESHITCPKCRSDKIENGECLKCGVVLEKYEKKNTTNAEKESIKSDELNQSPSTAGSLGQEEGWEKNTNNKRKIKDGECQSPERDSLITRFFQFAILLGVVIFIISIIHEYFIVPNSFIKIAEQGDANTKVGIANILLDSNVADWRWSLDETNFKLYLQAAEQGQKEAQDFVGWKYSYETRYPSEMPLPSYLIPRPDKVKGEYWLRKAAQQVCVLEREGKNYPGYKEYKTAQGCKELPDIIYWSLKAGELGYIEAYVQLGHHFSSRWDSNATEAIYWYSKAAELGHEIAQVRLANLYFEGREGFERKPLMAAYWAHKAAEQKHSWTLSGEASKLLGILYEEGDGVQQDTEMAVYWYRKAFAQCNGDFDVNSRLIRASSKGSFFKQVLLPYKLLHNYLFVKSPHDSFSRVGFIFIILLGVGLVIAFFLPVFFGRIIWGKIGKIKKSCESFLGLNQSVTKQNNNYRDGGRTMFCSHCGANILNEAFICPKCGCKTGKSNCGNGLVIASYIMNILIPLVGFIMGIVLLAKGRIGHGIANIFLAFFIAGIYIAATYGWNF